ncbi:MAG TPA: CHAT domain-containing protein [Thermoanaerobaculia bacterium]|nr:CHAT domain-containing protein [Thermoanaerobaculia bacterium]
MSEAYRRLGNSYAPGADPDKSEHRVFLDYYVKGMSAAADAFEASFGRGQVRNAEAVAQADALLRKAGLLSESKNCAQALPMLGEAEQLYQRAGFAVGEVRAVLRRAPCLAGSDSELAAMLKTAAKMLDALPQSSHDPKIAADALFHAGKGWEARAAYHEMLCRAERAKDAAGVASALLDLGKVQAAQGDLAEAEVSLQRSLSLLPFLDGDGDRNSEGLAHEILGRVLLAAGRLDEGTEELHRAREVWQRSGQPDREAASLGRLASGLANNGELAAALSVVREAEALRHWLPFNPESEGDLLLVKSSILEEQGKLQEALGSLYKAEGFYRQARLSLQMAAVGNVIRGLQEFLGRNGRDSEVLPPKEPEPDQRGQSDLLTRIEILQRFQALDGSGKHQEAGELCLQFALSFKQSGDLEGEALARGLLAVAYLEAGRGKEAREELDRANLLVSQGASVSAAPTPVQGLLSQITIMAKAYQSLESRLHEVPSPKNGPGGNGPHHSEAGNTLREDIQDLEKLGTGADADTLVHALKPMERILSGDLEGSFREVSETLSFFNQMGRGLTLSELKTPFFDRQFVMYSIGVELSLLTGRPETAFRYAEEARARAFADQIGNQRIAERRDADSDLLREERQLRLQLVSLKRALRVEEQKPLAEQGAERLASLQRSLDKAGQDYEELRLRLKATNPEYAALVGVDPIGLSEIQQQVLDDRTTLIEYFLPLQAEGGLGFALAFVMDREHFTAVRLPVTSADLKNRVIELRSLIEARQPVTTQAAALYQDLFAPLVPYIRHRNLVIVPHSLLHFLPFAALWDTKGQGYLGDAYTLSYSPSATALKFAREKKARPTGPVLAAGDPDGSLPQAAAEARAIARLYGDEPLLGRAATASAILARAGKAGILHLAAHAVLNPVNPLFTRIELAADAEHDGNLEMNEVLGLDLSKTGLVVLSGCSTQLGKLSTGDDLEGLTRAFIYAGTPAVVSSLWDVKDDSTSFFMERFYTHLRQGTGRAEALRQAQVETRRHFPHPYNWAAFVLTGDGR